MKKVSALISIAVIGGALLASTCSALAQGDVFQAEHGRLLGSAVQVTKDVTYVEGLSSEEDGVEIPVLVSTSGFYDIVVTQASVEGDYKENYVLVDGEHLGVVKVEGKDFTDDAISRVYLAEGAHTVSIMKHWGWVKLDKVTLSPSQELPQDLFDVSPALVNPNATDNAKRLMTYLADNYGKNILSGQACDDGMYGNENACIWRATGGKYPAVLGLDLIEYSPSRVANGSSARTIEHAIEYWDKGGIVTLCWHWNAPTKYITGTWYSAFYKDHTNIDLAKIMSGEDEEGYALLMADIDAIASQLLRLQDAGVPVLWRPLHEASGGWFWWGNAGANPYVKLYQVLYDRLTNMHGLNNLIWIWNGQDQDWYPGDAYVDIIGEDIYPGERVYTSQVNRFLQATRYTDARKMIVLSENGCLFDPDLAIRDGAMWGYFCTWGGEFVEKTKGVNKISERYTQADMVCKVYEHERVITREEIPDLKNYPFNEGE